MESVVHQGGGEQKESNNGIPLMYVHPATCIRASGHSCFRWPMNSD